MDEAPAPAEGAAGKTERPPFDTSVANQARIYDYLLGGKDNYAADRAAVDAVLKIAPEMGFTARANRAFLGRAVRYLAAEAGIRQFLDIGTGIPTAGNTHQVAQADRAGGPGGVRGLRPGRARARARAADQPPGGRHASTSTPTCATPTRSSTGPRGCWTSPSRWR